MEFTKEELEKEVWKDIPDYEGMYQVSDLGRVKSIDRYEYSKTWKKRFRKGKMLKFSIPKEYFRVTLTKNCKPKQYSVHRLVMLTFVGESDLVVDHINGNKLDNRLENLRYCTIRENNHFYVQTVKDRYSEYVGVTFSKSTGKWITKIVINNKKYHLGIFDNQEDASNVYQKALYEYLNYGKLPERVKPKTSSRVGVSYQKNRNKWCAIYKKQWLGYFDTEEEAIEMYDAFEKDPTIKIQKRESSKELIDKVTKQIFKTINEAAKFYDIPRQSLGKMLLGKLSNKTNLMYLKDYTETNQL